MEKSHHFQAGKLILCDIANSIYIRRKDSPDDITVLSRMSDEDKITILKHINSKQLNCLSMTDLKRTEKIQAILEVNMEILKFVHDNCWCMDDKLRNMFSK